MSTKKKELSKNTQGVSAFFNEASNYLNLEDLSKDYNLKKYKIKE
ncbi:hypothetical protein [Psychroserpens burtonensis]|nr:hypothetical protein [Psychroserpens burtonensis]